MNSYVGRFFHQIRGKQADYPPFEAGVFAAEGADFRKCHFVDCHLPSVSYPPNIHTIRNMTFTDCKVTACNAGTICLDDVTFDSLKIEGGGRMNMFIIWGAVFRHVVFKGKIGNLKINLTTHVDRFRDLPFNARWRNFYKSFYKSVDWAIDISKADFKLSTSFGWVPGSLVRRDPSTQVLVRRSQVQDRSYKQMPLSPLTKMELDFFVEDSPFDDTVLATFPSDRDKEKILQDFNLLREAKIAQLD